DLPDALLVALEAERANRARVDLERDALENRRRFDRRDDVVDDRAHVDGARAQAEAIARALEVEDVIDQVQEDPDSAPCRGSVTRHLAPVVLPLEQIERAKDPLERGA